MRKLFSLDRFEGDFAVCISDDDEKFDLPREAVGDMKQHDVFSAEIDGENLKDIIVEPDERDRRLARSRERLNRLFSRGKQ